MSHSETLATQAASSDTIWRWSNPRIVQRKANSYFGKHVPVYLSDRAQKKYKLQRPDGGWVHFGQRGYEDFTRHHDRQRRANYQTRSRHTRGDWEHDRYSANNLSRHLLW